VYGFVESFRGWVAWHHDQPPLASLQQNPSFESHVYAVAKTYYTPRMARIFQTLPTQAERLYRQQHTWSHDAKRNKHSRFVCLLARCAIGAGTALAL
jgi:hypothetical protein